VAGQPLSLAAIGQEGQTISLAAVAVQPLSLAVVAGQPFFLAAVAAQPLSLATVSGQPLTMAAATMLHCLSTSVTIVIDTKSHNYLPVLSAAIMHHTCFHDYHGIELGKFVS
jgi:hypothetical protein